MLGKLLGMVGLNMNPWIIVAVAGVTLSGYGAWGITKLKLAAAENRILIVTGERDAAVAERNALRVQLNARRDRDAVDRDWDAEPDPIARLRNQSRRAAPAAP